jgi:uncharacterized protein YggE
MTNCSVSFTAVAALLAGLTAGHAGTTEWERFPGVPYVMVDGAASTEKVPDQANLRFEVKVRATDAATAHGLLAPKAEKLIAALRQTGTPDQRITTDGPIATDVYDLTRDPNGREIVEKRVKVGVDVAYRVGVRIDGVDRPEGRERLERTMTAVMATDAALTSTKFTVSDDADIVAGLDREATKAAIAKAKGLIEAAGGRPGRVLAVYDSSHDDRCRGEADLVRPAQIRFVILPGTQRLQGRATVIVEILQP